jgi:acyl-CoA thioesterase
MDDVAGFLGLQTTDDPAHTRLPVVKSVTSTVGTLYGGAALAAAILTLEAATGRPCVWATGQFVSSGQLDDVVDFTVEVEARGHQLTQARALGTSDGRPVITVLAALGQRSFEAEGVWVTMPDVPPPPECPRRKLARHIAGTVHERVDLRVAKGRQVAELDGTPGDGTSALWARLPGSGTPNAASLAILGDFLASGVAQAIGLLAGGTSLDNTVRVVRLVPTEWVLVDTRIESLVGGFAHGRIHLWSQDGTLLGTAGQTVAVRRRDDWVDRDPDAGS